MAIYHLHAGFVSRSTGRTSVQSAAYICGEKLHEDHRNQTVDYTKRSHDVVSYHTIAPAHSRYQDLTVWNAIENFEDQYADSHFRKDEAREQYRGSAQVARTIVVALPNELSWEVNRELVETFVRENFLSRNLITTYALHDADGNKHAHLQISLRALGEDGEFVKRKDREMCTRSALRETRTLWADCANTFLEREGFQERITEKSFADLGIDLEASGHRGWYADQLGEKSRIHHENQAIMKRNEETILANPSLIFDVLNEKKAVFTQKDILREIGQRVVDPKRMAVIFEKVLEEAQYVGERGDGTFLYTGERYQKLESEVLSQFDRFTQKTVDRPCSEDSIQSVLERYAFLSDEQKTAVKGLGSDRSMELLVGKAGAGKTTTMKAVAELYQQNGSRVIGMSVSAVASENLGKDAGIESHTMASWAHRWRTYERAQAQFLSFDAILTEGMLKQRDWYRDLKRYSSSQLKKGDVILVDEAGMVGTQDWHTLLTFAEQFEAKVILVGDDNQLKPIAAGDCFRHFLQHHPENVLTLNEIRRQKVDWMKEASVAFSQLKAAEGLARYEKEGRLHTLTHLREIAQHSLDQEQEGTVAILCATRSDCQALNDEVRALKKERGELGEDLLTVNGRALALQDVVMFLKNDPRMDVKNGERGVIQSYQEGVLHVQTETGLKMIDTNTYTSLDHGYAMTLHKAQGKTFDQTLVVAHKSMDAPAFYVGMTRHREDVHLYYAKESFPTFKDLVMSASTLRFKESVEDYQGMDNFYKARVYEYKETLLETASVLKEIAEGTATWSDYHTLKKASTDIGRELLAHYPSHKLYLDQLGMTHEKLEITVGVKPRPLSQVEMTAQKTVELYAKASLETRELYQTMRKECFNITKHKEYAHYCERREGRNDLAKEILSNYPLHREFVNVVSKDVFISKKAMENQVQYAERVQKGEMSEEELRTRSDVTAYVIYHQRAQALYQEMTKTTTDITQHKEYRRYQQEVERRDRQGEVILADYSTYQGHLARYEKQGITKSLLEQQQQEREERFKNTFDERVDVGKTLESLVKGFENMKQEERPSLPYEGATLSELMTLQQGTDYYQEWSQQNIHYYGYAPHISRAMMMAYCEENNLRVNMTGDTVTNEYASLLAHRTLEERGMKTLTLDVAEESVKQALCFKVLKETHDIQDLTPDKLKTLDQQAYLLNRYVTKENLRVLENKPLMKEASQTLATQDTQPLHFTAKEEAYLLKLSQQDREKEQASKTYSREAEHVHERSFDRSR